MGELIFIDTEVSVDTGHIFDFGAINDKGEKLHTGRADIFLDFIKGASFLCGHNIINHDLKYISSNDKSILEISAIDTLSLSPLLFPKKPFHRLVKDDKLNTEQLNNPLNDSIQAKNLFYDEVSSYHRLDNDIKKIYNFLLRNTKEFKGFLKYIKTVKNDDIKSPMLAKLLGQSTSSRQNPNNELEEDNSDSLYLIKLIKNKFKGMICENADLALLIDKSPVELAYGERFCPS